MVSHSCKLIKYYYVFIHSILYKTPMNGVLRNHKLGSKIGSHNGNLDLWFCAVLLTLLGDPNVIL